jgi:hypothetical protein
VELLEVGALQRRVAGELAEHAVLAHQLLDHGHDGVVVDDLRIGPEVVEGQGDVVAVGAPVGVVLLTRDGAQQERLEGLVPGVDLGDGDQALEHGRAGAADLVRVGLGLFRVIAAPFRW